MKLLHKALHLKPSDRQLLLTALALLLTIRLGLWLLPFPTWRRLFTQVMQTKTNLPPISTTTIDQIVWAVSVASRYLPGEVKCLARALATQILLHRYGYTATLCLGVAKGEKGQLEAHAWVESQGEVVIGGLSNLSSFTLLSSLGGSQV